MFKAILLFIQKMALKRKLKKEKLKSEKNALAASADGKDTKEVKKIKRKLFKINILLLFTLLQPFLVMLIVSAFGIHIFLMMGTVSGNRSIFNKDDPEASESMPGEWDFDIYDPEDLWGNYGINPDGTINISGGLYPKDPTLKQVAIMLEVMDKACEKINGDYGTKVVTPEGILAVIIKERGGAAWNLVVGDKSANVFSELLYDNPICGEGDSCVWIKGGTSHFNGGSVINGKDGGDPRTQSINSDKTLYNKYKAIDPTTGHAVGPGQFETIYVDNHLTEVYPIGDYASKRYDNNTDRYKMDSQLNFIRPNIAYIPDVIISIAGSIGGTNNGTATAWSTMQNESWFKSLTDDEKAYCKQSLKMLEYAGTGYEAPNICKLFLKTMWGLKEDGKIQNIYEFTTYINGKYGYKLNATIQSNKTIKYGGWQSAVNAINAFLADTNLSTNTASAVKELKAALSAQGYSKFNDPNTNSNSYINHIPNPVYLMSGSYDLIAQLRAEVAAAEKEAPIGGTVGAVGQWIDYVGSGKFKPIGNGKYYSQKVQATLFTQDTGSGTFREASWGSLKVNGVQMWTDGCGVYSTAFCITNLTGQVVTVEDIYNKKLIGSLPLPNSNVIKIAQAYGLDAYTMSIAKDGNQFGADVIQELKSGGLIVAVFRDASCLGENDKNFSWYSNSRGNGAHFMVIRGYNQANNKLRVFTSCGANGVKQEDVCEIELDAVTVRKYLSSSYTTCEVIKPKGGIPQSNGGSTGSGSSEYIWPLNGIYNISSKYGNRTLYGKPDFHLGVDIPAASGTNICATKPGTVITVNNSASASSYGLYVKIKHTDGTYSLYAHMSKTNTTLNTTVNQGDIIGYVGTTGNSSGNHLHFEIRNTSDKTTDPLGYFSNIQFKYS